MHSELSGHCSRKSFGKGPPYNQNSHNTGCYFCHRVGRCLSFHQAPFATDRSEYRLNRYNKTRGGSGTIRTGVWVEEGKGKEVRRKTKGFLNYIDAVNLPQNVRDVLLRRKSRLARRRRYIYAQGETFTDYKDNSCRLGFRGGMSTRQSPYVE